MVAAMPFIVIKLEGKNFTRIQAIVFFLMWVILFGGVFLFTQILYFNSAHFETVRHLTIVEAVYFLSQVLTTVGYGDVTPATSRAQVFVGLYVLFSLLVIANVISEVGDCIAKHVKRVGLEVIRRYRQAQELVDNMGTTVTGHAASELFGAEDERQASLIDISPREKLKRKPLSYFELKPPRLDWLSVLGATTQFFFFVVVGVLFYHNYPGEEKTVFNAVYMSVITLSTVGFGVITPQTEAGKVFGAFWMLFGSGALVGLVGSLTDLYGQIKAKEIWDARDHDKEKEAFFEACPAQMEKYEFVKRALLYQSGVQEEHLAALEAIFDHLKEGKEDGKIAKQELQDLLAEAPNGTKSQSWNFRRHVTEAFSARD
jgi:voltage-gated potassium channel Kch